MRRLRIIFGVALISSVLVGSAGASEKHVALSNEACAQQITSTWTDAQLANETIAIPVEATNIGALAPAARAGYGGILLFGSSAPASMPKVLATLQRERPGHYAWMVMTDEEGGGVERLDNLVGSFPWAQTMGKNLDAAQITAIARRVGTALSAAGVNTDLAPVLDVDGRAQYPGAANPDGYRSFSGVPSRRGHRRDGFHEGAPGGRGVVGRQALPWTGLRDAQHRLRPRGHTVVGQAADDWSRAVSSSHRERR